MKLYVTYTKNSFTERQMEELSRGWERTYLFGRHFCFR